MLSQDAITPRVNALAKLIGDTVEAFFERPNGEVVIVFTNKGKRIFVPEPTIEPEVPDFEKEAETPAPAETEEAVIRPAAHLKRKEKRN